MKKLIVVLVLILLSPLLVLLFAAAMLISVCIACYSWMWLVWFCWRHADRIYLICSRRRGWAEFLANNVIPALPDHVTPVWIESPKRLAHVIRAMRLSRSALSKPFLILITPFGIKSTPLNERLYHLKRFGKGAATVRADVRRVVDLALDDFSRWSRTD